MSQSKKKAEAPAAAKVPAEAAQEELLKVESADVKGVTQALAAPFDPAEVKWKPQHVSGNRALVVAFVDARVIQDRLDEVLGVMGWQDSYERLPDGAVVCRLQVRLGDEWITKVDVGGQSEQPDEGDRTKAAFSDALKRAAVKFGIGRYLYRLEPQWVDYDPQKKKLVGTPRLPAGALPKGTSPRLHEVAAEAPAAAAAAPAKPARGMPASGAELKERLSAHDARLAREGVCKAGALLRHVQEAGEKAGHGKDMATWTGPAIQLAIDETRAFEANQRKALEPAAKAG